MNYRALIVVLKNAYECFFLVQFSLRAYKTTSYETHIQKKEKALSLVLIICHSSSSGNEYGQADAG